MIGVLPGRSFDLSKTSDGEKREKKILKHFSLHSRGREQTLPVSRTQKSLDLRKRKDIQFKAFRRHNNILLTNYIAFAYLLLPDLPPKMNI